MRIGTPCPAARPRFRFCIAVAAIFTVSPLMGQEPIRLAAERVTITPKFETEGLPNKFDEGDSPLAMTTIGGGNTWESCLAYSPDGTSLAVGDRPMRPLCTLGSAGPVNENGGLIRIVDVATRRVTRTIRPAKRPRHEYEIVSLAYTPDGKTLVAHGKEDWPKEGRGREIGYHVTAWDAASGRVLRRIDSAKMDDWQLPTFSPDASTFATITNAGVRVWDVATGRPRPTPAEAPRKPDFLSFSPDGKTLAADDELGEVGLWDVATGRRVARIPGISRQGDTFAFSPDGRTLTCGSLVDGGLEQFRWDNSSRPGLLDAPRRLDRAPSPNMNGSTAHSVAYSPDGKTLAVVSYFNEGHRRGVLSLRDAATGKERASVAEIKDTTKLTYAPDGSSLITADRTWITLRDPIDGHERTALHQGDFTSSAEEFALAPDGRTLASTNGTFQLWDLRAVSAPVAGGHRFEVTCLAYAPDGRTLASASVDRTVKLWDVASRRPRLTLVGHTDDVVRLAYVADGRAIASADAAGWVRIWDTTTGACRATIRGADAPPELMTFAPDGRSLSVVSWKWDRPTEVRRWDATTGATLASPEDAANVKDPLTFSSDGGLVVSPGPLRIEVRDSWTWKLRSELPQKDEPLCLAISRDGEVVLQMTMDSSIAIHRRIGGAWRTEEIFKTEGTGFRGGSIVAGPLMTATPDGRWLAAICDERLRVFNTSLRKPIAVFGDVDDVNWLALSPDGKSLATARTGGDIVIYDSGKSAAIDR